MLFDVQFYSKRFGWQRLQYSQNTAAKSNILTDVSFNAYT